MNLNDMTIPQLKEHADTIGVEYTSKIRKADLIDLIIKRETEIAQASKPLSEKGVCDCDSYEPCYGECCGEGNCSCSLEPKPLPDNSHRQAKREDRHVAEALPADSPERTPATPHQLEEAAKALETLRNYRAPVAIAQPKSNRKGLVDGNPMGMHYRGRALGLKHYQAMGLAIGRTAAGFDGQLIPRGFAAHLPNSERVQNYARFAGGRVDYTVGHPKLTPRQMRRVRKNANKHAEGFMYASNTTGIAEREEGYSLLARTPEGMGICHKFAN